MRKILILIPAFAFILLACTKSSRSHKFSAIFGQGEVSSEIIDTSGKTIQSRFNVPEGYKRVDASPGSFAAWLRLLPLKKDGSKVMLYDGKEKWRQDVHAAVINMDVGKYDLQQCADAVMRLRSEYLFSRNDYEKIHFNFTSGHRCDYTQWAEGFRPVISGNKVTFSKKAEKDYSYKEFRKYLHTVFTYAGTLSLSKELKKVKEKADIKAGDVFIHGGLPGHAVIVVDVAVNEKTGRKIFMIAQSYMPAQEIHVLKNFSNAMSPWYEDDFSGGLSTPEWEFETSELMRFEQD